VEGGPSPRAANAEGVTFLQWVLPCLGLRWKGFRNVRGQVLKRICLRAGELGLPSLTAYHEHLRAHPTELAVVAHACRVTISRFYRDRGIFDHLFGVVLPRLAAAAVARGERELRAWSAGCASGEEPYTVAIGWHLALASHFPDLALAIIATDVDAELLARARRGCYAESSLRECPAAWRDSAFRSEGGLACVREELRRGVDLRLDDLRVGAPDGRFGLVLCRNLAFTYFDTPLQREVAARLVEHLLPGGALVLGCHEEVPAGTPGLAPGPMRGLYERSS
jgi:chemotaxis protein methyltransferase CheR